MARVDFLLARGTGEIFVNEVNTIPGLHHDQHVLEAVGRDRRSTTRRLLDRLIALALERHAEKQQLRTSLT